MSLLRRLGSMLQAAAPYRKYGLVSDDLIVETPEVAEALRRMHPSVLAARDKRFKLAFDASLKRTYLPEELWTKEEEDKPYLEPHLSNVIAEKHARSEFRA